MSHEAGARGSAQVSAAEGRQVRRGGSRDGTGGGRGESKGKQVRKSEKSR